MEPLKSYNRMTDGAMEPMEQALTYYNILTRNGEQGYPFYCHSKSVVDEETGNKTKAFGQYCSRTPEAFTEQYKSWHSNWNCYISLNLFKGEYRYNEGKKKRGYFREEADVKTINGFLVDFDIMKGKSVKDSYTIEKGDAIIKEVIEKIEELIAEKKMIKPTVMTFSGRGAQMLYLYEKPVDALNDISKYKHRKLFSYVVNYIQSYFDEEYVEVDKSVRDYSRVCRLPGTMHQGNNRMAELQEINAECFYDLDELIEFFGIDTAPEAKKKVGRPAKEAEAKSTPKKSKDYYHAIKKSKTAIELELECEKNNTHQVNFIKYLKKRRNTKGKIAALEKLAEMRGMSDGDDREVMLHIYYSLNRRIKTAEEAAKAVREFNQSFAEPHEDCVVNSLIKNADTHKGYWTTFAKEVGGEVKCVQHKYPDGYYEASRDGIIEMLGMTEAEIEGCGITKRQKEKERALLNNEIEARVKARLIEMLGSGASKPEMVKYIKQESGKSRATAYRWITDCETEIAKRKMEENAERETEVESFLSHFGVNVKEEINREEAKGGSERRLVLLTDNSDPSKNKVWIQKIEEDEKYNYIYNKIEYPTPKGMHCQESYEIRLRSDELSRYYLRKSTKIMYSPSGEILSKKETGWEIRGPGMFRKAV